MRRTREHERDKRVRIFREDFEHNSLLKKREKENKHKTPFFSFSFQLFKYELPRVFEFRNKQLSMKNRNFFEKEIFEKKKNLKCECERKRARTTHIHFARGGTLPVRRMRSG